MLLSSVDRACFVLFSRRADLTRHEQDREYYRGAALGVSFDTFLARLYGCAWVIAGLMGALMALVILSIPHNASGMWIQSGYVEVGRFHQRVIRIPVEVIAVGCGISAAVTTKQACLWIGCQYLKLRADSRRTEIEQTLPGAVRYLRALANGGDNRRMLLEKVAEQEAFGETSVEFTRVLQKATITGSLDAGLRGVARDTPSRHLLAPFLLKFREHASQGSDALGGYLTMEARMLSHQERRDRQRANDFLELLAELFIVLLILPALLVVVITVMSVLAPSLSYPVPLPGAPSVRTILIYGGAIFVLVVGAFAALLVNTLRPPGNVRSYSRPKGIHCIRSVTRNPASAALLGLPLAIIIGFVLIYLQFKAANALLLSYAFYGLPVGVVGLRRARIDDEKDREIRDFIHAVAGHVSLGKPFSLAVEQVARDVDFGALQADIEHLAFTLRLTNPGTGDVRSESLNAFVEKVGTPLAEQTVSLVTGALEVGSDAESTFDTLQTEVGRLYHQRKTVQNAMMVYVIVGWTTAILVVGIIVAVNIFVLDGFSHLTSVSDGLAIDPHAIDETRDAWRFYLVSQATMLACGWFAGAASRGKYDALLHSGLLVLICYIIFVGANII